MEDEALLFLQSGGAHVMRTLSHTSICLSIRSYLFLQASRSAALCNVSLPHRMREGESSMLQCNHPYKLQ